MDDSDPFLEDLKNFVATGRTMVEELMDEAQSGNLERLHHLESAVGCWEQAAHVVNAIRVAQDFIDSLTDIQPPAS